MHAGMVSQLLLLLVIANGVPALIGLLSGTRCNRPLDGGHYYTDGRPLLGPSKTWRGLFSALLATSLLAPLIDLPIMTGAGFALLAMLGDSGSSFIKRRIGLASGRSVPLLDQLPESVLPLCGMQAALHAGLDEMALAVCLFILIDLLLTQALKITRKY